MIIFFFYGLFFEGLGLIAFLQFRRGGDLPLRKQLPWLAAFGFTYGAAGWIDMFLMSGMTQDLHNVLTIMRMVLQPLSGLLLLIFGWRILTKLTPLPSWSIFIPGVLIVPIALVITYAATTFITPSPIEIPIDIWSRYLLYLPGSIMAGIGFVRQWHVQRKLGYPDVSKLMFWTGMAFLFEAFMVGLIVPAAPYGPASYYNYDRVLYDAFTGDQLITQQPFGLSAWLDYEHVLKFTGLPVQFWRLLSAIAVTYFVMRGLDVFDAIRKRKLDTLQEEIDQAQREAFQAQIEARRTAETWTDALVRINRRIVELVDVDNILFYIIENARTLLISDFAAIGIYNEQHFCLEIKCQSSVCNAELQEPAPLVKNPILIDSLVSPKTYLSEHEETSNRLDGLGLPPGQHAKYLAVVPLTMDNNPIGALWMLRCTDEPYDETDLIWLECMADQIVIAIQHGLMTAQIQTLSVVEERARIAREMHDGLAQILGYLNLQVQTLEALLKKKKWESLSEELQHLREGIQVAHADVRENILSLRTTLANESGLVPAIAEYINEYSLQTGVGIQFNNLAGEELELSSIAEVQLVCILQEALTNVRKHAQATQVCIELDKVDQQGQENIRMLVDDDGVGFDTNIPKRSFGLQTMRERAESVQGELRVASIVGQGSHVELVIPCLPEESVRQPSLLLSKA